MYAKYIKRPLDFFLSFCALTVLSPVFLVLIILGAVKMKGNPFFVQLRPGKDEEIFCLIKFRTMTCETDKDGNLLPDEERLTKYGQFLRSTSLDELPELINIFMGDMAVIGPRPLLVNYIPYYTDEERHRHDIRPGLTGLAQVSGRNTVTWEKRFEIDIQYRNNITFLNDVKIIIDTIKSVLSHESIELNAMENFDEYRRKQMLEAHDNTKVGTV